MGLLHSSPTPPRSCSPGALGHILWMKPHCSVPTWAGAGPGLSPGRVSTDTWGPSPHPRLRARGGHRCRGVGGNQVPQETCVIQEPEKPHSKDTQIDILAHLKNIYQSKTLKNTLEV